MSLSVHSVWRAEREALKTNEKIPTEFLYEESAKVGKNVEEVLGFDGAAPAKTHAGSLAKARSALVRTRLMRKALTRVTRELNSEKTAQLTRD